MVDFVKVVTTILPPMSPMQTWRVLVAIGLMMAGVHVAWACGYIPGLAGFAQTAQVEQIKKTVDDGQKKTEQSVEAIKQTQGVILTRLIASDVESARASQCKALAEGNQAAAQGWRVRLDASLYEYRYNAQRDYVLRPCSEY